MFEQTPAISVVVPIYNAMPHLPECLDSIVSQTYANIEIICVNDGSTDNSLDVVRSYEQKDNRIAVVDKKNGGYGQAVNCGIAQARGQWISIIEPDDFIGPYMYEDLLSHTQLEDGGIADVVKSSYWRYFAYLQDHDPYFVASNLMNCMPKQRMEFAISDHVEVLRHHPSIWSAIYRREFLETCGIRMIEPPGAGWADNPWLFETLLQAKAIVWVPAAYYYYREDNPEGSSNLSDYRMVFDRLRDIRAVYKRLGINAPDLLRVLYQRSFNYINLTVLKEHGFNETDPELQTLIRETLDSMDAALLLEPGNGIPGWAKDYYRDVMGLFTAEIPNRPVYSEPFVTFVMPLCNDREGLWPTLNSLLSQSEQCFQVVCVDCDSNDRSCEIVQAVSLKDARFSLAPTQATSVQDAYNIGLDQAQGRYVWFLRPGCTFASPFVLECMADAADLLSEGDADFDCLVPAADISLFGASSLGRQEEMPASLQVSVLGNETKILTCASMVGCSRAWKTSMVKQASLAFSESDDPDGYTFTARALLACSEALLVKGSGIVCTKRAALNFDEIFSEEQAIQREQGKCQKLYSDALAAGTEAAARVARHGIVRCLGYATSFIGRDYMHQAYFDALKDMFENRFGLLDVPASDYVVIDQFHHLKQLFALDYIGALERRAQVAFSAANQRDSAPRRLKGIKNSGTYRIAHRLSTMYKSIIPAKVRKQGSWKGRS